MHVHIVFSRSVLESNFVQLLVFKLTAKTCFLQFFYNGESLLLLLVLVRSTKEERFLISWVACYRVGSLCTQAKPDPCFFVPWFTFSAPFWMTSQFRCAKHSASWFKLYLRHKQLSYGNHVHHWFHQGQLDDYTGIFEFGKRMNFGVVF